MKQVDTITMVAKRTRRQHSAEFKSQVVKACCAPGVSIAGVALAHGLNANLVRRWLTEHGVTPQSRRAGSQSAGAVLLPTPPFVPVTVESAPAALPEIRIEVRRGAACDAPLACAGSGGMRRLAQGLAAMI